MKKKTRLEQFSNDFYKTAFKPGHAELIGHITMCHLIIERSLIQFIQVANPNLGDLAKLQLGFGKTLDLALSTRRQIAIIHQLAPPLRALNQLRNSIVHKHCLEDTDAEKPFAAFEAYYRSVIPKKERRDLSETQLLHWLTSFTAGWLKAAEEVSKLEDVHLNKSTETLPIKSTRS